MDSYASDQKELGSATQLDFEQVRDLDEPIHKFIPFIFYNRNVKINNYEAFLCFMNIEDINLEYQQEDHINFQDFIQVFKLGY